MRKPTMGGRFGTAVVLVLLATGCAGGPARRPEAQPDFSTRVSALASDVVQGGTFPHAPGRTPDGGIGMTHTAGAVGSAAGAGNATGAATHAMGTSAVIIGNVAIVGIDPQVWPALGTTMLHGVRTRIREQFPQLAEVQVVTTPEQAAAVARLQRQMHEGVPASSLMTEVLQLVETAR